jgi:hypothetical protein
MMKSVYFLTILFSLSAMVFGQPTSANDNPKDVTNLWSPVAEDSTVTYADLLKKTKANSEIKRQGGGLGMIYEGKFPRDVVEKMRALWFFAGNRKYLAMVVHFRNPFDIRSGYINDSVLLVFDFLQREGNLVESKPMEHPQAQPSTLDFYDDLPIVILKNGTNREEAFWITTTRMTRNQLTQKFSLFTLRNKRLVETLSHLPTIKTFRDDNLHCLSRQELSELSTSRRSGAKSDDYPNLQIKVLEYAHSGDDCSKGQSEPKTIMNYDAIWTGKIYRAQLSETEIPFSIPPAATPTPDEVFSGSLRLGKVYRAGVVSSRIGDGWQLAVPLEQKPGEIIKVEWYYKDRSLLAENKLKPGERREITFQIISEKTRRVGKRLVRTFRGFVYPIGEEIPEC